MGRPRVDPALRFWRFVSPEPNTGCWLWMGAFQGKYPVFGVDGATTGAHRYALAEASGGDQPDMQACHRCDTPACVNPSHLFWGTALDNKRDEMAKGRQARGAHNGNARLTREHVDSIRAEYAGGGISQRAIAVKHGVCQRTVTLILNRLTWRD